MESANSLNTFFRHPSGYVCQITIRSENSQDLLTRFEKLLAWLQQTGCQPAERAEAVAKWPDWWGGGPQVQVHDPPANGSTPTNGGLSTTTPTLPDGNPDPAWCSIHGVAMRRREANGQVWYSHKVGDGWCKGRLPKNGH